MADLHRSPDVQPRCARPTASSLQDGRQDPHPRPRRGAALVCRAGCFERAQRSAGPGDPSDHAVRSRTRGCGRADARARLLRPGRDRVARAPRKGWSRTPPACPPHRAQLHPQLRGRGRSLWAGPRRRAALPIDTRSIRRAVGQTARSLPRCSPWSSAAVARSGFSDSICNHSFRATGITLHQENGGDIETAARLAGHADTRTTHGRSSWDWSP